MSIRDIETLPGTQRPRGHILPPLGRFETQRTSIPRTHLKHPPPQHQWKEDFNYDRVVEYDGPPSGILHNTSPRLVHADEDHMFRRMTMKGEEHRMFDSYHHGYKQHPSSGPPFYKNHQRPSFSHHHSNPAVFPQEYRNVTRKSSFEHHAKSEGRHVGAARHSTYFIDGRGGRLRKTEQQGGGGVPVEISPGHCALLRTAEETSAAIKDDYFFPFKCMGCEREILCIADAKFVICPSCRVVSPLQRCSDEDNLNDYRYGVGLGFSFETMVRIKSDS